MADKKMSALDAITSVGDSDIMHVVQSGANKKVTKANLHAGLTKNTDTNVKGNSWVVDEDAMTSNLDTKVPTQQSVKAYADGIGSAKANATHASQHTNGTDDIQNATAAQKGLMTATYASKLDGIEASADVTDATNVDAAGATMNTDTDVKANSWVIDEDTLASNLDTKVPTQQSVKAYADTKASASHTHTESQISDLGTAVTLNADTDVKANGWVIDEDAMGTNTDTKVPTQQSVKAYVDTAVGGVSGELFWDCEVNGGGGADYTTLGAAFTAGHKRVLVTGSTTETGNVTVPDNVYVCGVTPKYSDPVNIIMGDYQFDGWIGGEWSDIGITSTRTSGGVFDGVLYATTFKNVFFAGTAGGTGGAWWVNHLLSVRFDGCRFTNSKMAIIKNSSSEMTLDIEFRDCYIDGSGLTSALYLFDCDWDNDAPGNRVLFTNTYMYSGGRILRIDASDSTMSDSHQGWTFVGCQLDWGSSVTGFYLDYVKVSLFNCGLKTSSGQLVEPNGNMHLTLNGCHLEGVTALEGADSGSSYKIALHNCSFSTADVKLAESDTPTNEPLVELYGCSYSGIVNEQEEMMDRKIVWIENASGGALAQGDVVTLVSTADAGGSRLEVTTTTSADDENAFGVVAVGGADGAAVAVLVQGFCYHTKVDGTTDIVTNDLLGTHTVAGIAAKSTTRGARFAKAIGGYTSDDSSGVVKSYLFGHMR